MDADSGGSLLGLIRNVYRWRKLIGSLVICFGLLTVIIVAFLPNAYHARGTILLEMSDSPISLDILGSLGPLAGLSGNTSSAEVYLAILQSRMVKEAVIDSLNLSTYYNIDGVSAAQIMEKTCNKLEDKVRFAFPETVTLSITTEDSDPEMAAKITNVFLNRLVHANQTLALSRSHRTRLMIEDALAKTEIEIEAARVQLGQFQTRNGVFALDEQTKATLTMIAQLQGQLLEAQTRRIALAGVLREKSPDVRSLEMTIEAIENQIDRLVGGQSVEGNGSDSEGNGFILPLGDVPELTGEYARIMMDLTVLETKYAVLATQLETTKIEESQSVPSFEILDRAQRPFTRSGPNRFAYILSAMALGLVIGILLALLFGELDRRVSPSIRAELIAMLPAGLAGRLLNSQLDQNSSSPGYKG